LLLVRITARTREIAVRAAIGAGRGRIARQLLTENFLIAAIGGVAGLLMAEMCLRALVLVGPANIPRLDETTIDVYVLVFAVVVALATGFFAGVGPVLNSRKTDLSLALKDGSPGSGAAWRGNAFRGGLVVAEIAITLTLLFGSGLLIRSLIIANTRYPGFDSDHLLALELQLPTSGYKTDQSIRQFYGRLSNDLRAQSGIDAVGAVTCPPSGGDCGDYWYSILGMPVPDRGDVPIALFNTADAAYFETMHIRLVAGRGFTQADQEKGTPVAVVNEELARKWWTTPEQALGRQLKMGGPYMEGPVYEIAGVVGNVSQMGLDAQPMPEIFFAFSQRA